MKRENDRSKRCTVTRSGAQCGLTDGHDGFHMFFCNHGNCPGYPLPNEEFPHPGSCLTGDLMDNDENYRKAVHQKCIEILSKFHKPGTEIFECPLCGNKVQRLFIATEGGDDESEVSYEVCASCYEDIEGSPPEMRSKMPEMASVTISMDKRMLNHLFAQSQIEGYLDVAGYLHTIIFREAAKLWLENLADPETVEEQAEFVQEMKDWMRIR